jgi:hypothetical protein
LHEEHLIVGFPYIPFKLGPGLFIGNEAALVFQAEVPHPLKEGEVKVQGDLEGTGNMPLGDIPGKGGDPINSLNTGKRNRYKPRNRGSLITVHQTPAYIHRGDKHVPGGVGFPFLGGGADPGRLEAQVIFDSQVYRFLWGNGTNFLAQEGSTPEEAYRKDDWRT